MLCREFFHNVQSSSPKCLITPARAHIRSASATVAPPTSPAPVQTTSHCALVIGPSKVDACPAGGCMAGVVVFAAAMADDRKVEREGERREDLEGEWERDGEKASETSQRQNRRLR